MNEDSGAALESEQQDISSAVEGEATVADSVPASARPHYDKLLGLLANSKLPEVDKPRIEAALEHYRAWVAGMEALSSEGDQRVRELVALLNDYKLAIEFDLVFESPENILYRQSGQLKLSSSVLEEFLPRLADPRILPSLRGKQYESGPRTSFASIYFMSTVTSGPSQIGLRVRVKNQDFTIGRQAYVKASFDQHFAASGTAEERIYLAYIAAECKTNLDKSMWQEATATAHDLRVGLPGSRYFLLCEWLDMPVPSREGTDIHTVYIFRGKRLTSNVREGFATAEGRQKGRDSYLKRLRSYPIKDEVMLAFVHEMQAIIERPSLSEEDVLARGYF